MLAYYFKSSVLRFGIEGKFKRGKGLMWTMVDGQADHALTHNRPERSRAHSVCAPRAIRFFFLLLKERRRKREREPDKASQRERRKCLFRLRRPPTHSDSFLSGFRYALVAFLN
ncbi:hypothetical protein EOE71_18225 [Vibrio cholerae]|nr:hypothetical protein [Vibrio cholerae]